MTSSVTEQMTIMLSVPSEQQNHFIVTVKSITMVIKNMSFIGV